MQSRNCFAPKRDAETETDRRFRGFRCCFNADDKVCVSLCVSNVLDISSLWFRKTLTRFTQKLGKKIFVVYAVTIVVGCAGEISIFMYCRAVLSLFSDNLSWQKRNVTLRLVACVIFICFYFIVFRIWSNAKHTNSFEIEICCEIWSRDNERRVDRRVNVLLCWKCNLFIFLWIIICRMGSGGRVCVFKDSISLLSGTTHWK